MAKKQQPDLSNIFANTERQDPELPAEEEPKDPIKPLGIGMRVSEWAWYKQTAKDLGMKPHGLALFALRYFRKLYEIGKIEFESKPHPKMPE